MQRLLQVDAEMPQSRHVRSSSVVLDQKCSGKAALQEPTAREPACQVG
jgi:hypothetical protein